MRRWRKMTWVLLAANVFFLLLLVAALAADASCKPGDEVCSSSQAADRVLGAVVVGVLWFSAFVVLSLIWLMTRPHGRACPACGQDVKRGRTTCKKCGYDFAAAAALVAERGAIVEAQDVRHWT
jgi:hypothetical protein